MSRTHIRNVTRYGVYRCIYAYGMNLVLGEGANTIGHHLHTPEECIDLNDGILTRRGQSMCGAGEYLVGQMSNEKFIKACTIAYCTYRSAPNYRELILFLQGCSNLTLEVIVPELMELEQWNGLSSTVGLTKGTIKEAGEELVEVFHNPKNS